MIFADIGSLEVKIKRPHLQICLGIEKASGDSMDMVVMITLVVPSISPQEEYRFVGIF